MHFEKMAPNINSLKTENSGLISVVEASLGNAAMWDNTDLLQMRRKVKAVLGM